MTVYKTFNDGRVTITLGETPAYHQFIHILSRNTYVQTGIKSNQPHSTLNFAIYRNEESDVYSLFVTDTSSLVSTELKKYSFQANDL